MEEESKHPRRRSILQKFLSLNECKELEFIHKSCSTVGYRPNVLSTTLSHLIATNSPHFIIPFLPIRERLKEKVEEFFGCEYELFIEFTALISWTRGASCGWHSDDNRPYLKQRHFTVFCYLNSYDMDFKGGLFHFQDGEPTTVVPLAGDVVIYTADSSNIHSVDEIINGERLTLTLWFSRGSAHDEDAKLITLLSKHVLCSSCDGPELFLPLPASSNMYWFSQNQASDHQSGFDICCARIHVNGFDIYSSQGKICSTELTELLLEPLQLAKGDELFEHKFVNILHALQAVQFYRWRASGWDIFKAQVEPRRPIRLSQTEQGEISYLKSIFLKDQELAEAVFNTVKRDEGLQLSIDWANFSAAVTALEDYSCKLGKELLNSLPHWRTHQSIYCVQFHGP
ncbi:2OG-FeII_Oxy_4 domain-containing protein [Cephalotus follicularis]|uniref:procollagen-proline 3-dioxygenase n=1 Tax=Cephalotus follicularis TaxID=3775 RepID=A0A1Q3AUH8_CEPFO|nr:2OG-FeII_Oxy_4 domain-containing protein [Cephalotus follicularis]